MNRTISRKKWDEELDKVDVSKRDLNLIILDYLIIEGFSDAALQFARETGLPLDIDQAAIQERMDIVDAVEDGKVEEAVRRVNEMDPEILDTNPTLLFQLHLLHLIELIRTDQVKAGLDFAAENLAPRGAQNPELLPDLQMVMGLLAFPALAKYGDDTQGFSAASGSDVPGGLDSETEKLFSDSAFKPLANLMTRQHRCQVAKSLNAVILQSQGQAKDTKVVGLVRLMSWGEERLERAAIGLPEGEKSRGREWAQRVLEESTAE